MIWTAITSFLSLRKLEIYGVSIVALVLFGAWQGARLQSWRDASEIAKIKAQEQTNISLAIAAAQKQCEANAAITWEASNEFQKDLQGIDTRAAADSSRMRAETNSPGVPVSHSASRPNASPSRAGTARECRIPPESVLSLGATCQRYVAQIVRLQQFIRAERK